MSLLVKDTLHTVPTRKQVTGSSSFDIFCLSFLTSRYRGPSLCRGAGTGIQRLAPLAEVQTPVAIEPSSFTEVNLQSVGFCCLDFTNALSHLFPITRYPHSSHTHKNSTNCSSFQQLTLPRSRILSTMSTADELKALGNKAIAEKNFDEAVLVTSTVVSFVLLLSDTNRSHPAEQSSPRPLPWHPKTTSSTATGPPPTPQRKTTQTP